MIKKRFVTIFSVVIALLCCFCVTACNKPAAVKAEPYPEDFMCGYFITFYDGETALTDENFESAEAVKNYFYKHKFSGGYTTYTVTGLHVGETFITVEGSPLSPDKSGKVTLTDKIYFTPELADKTIKLSVVNYNYEKGEVYTEHVSTSNFTGLSMQFFGNDMNATVETDSGFEKITYELDGSITFIQVDKLVEMQFLEFNESDICDFRVSTTDFDTFDSYTAHAEAEYLIVEKKYQKADGEYYIERLVYSKGENCSERLYIPCGNGLTRPVDFKINFEQKEGEV